MDEIVTAVQAILVPPPPRRPHGDAQTRRRHGWQIWAARRAGWTGAALGRRYRVSRERIRQIDGRMEARFSRLVQKIIRSERRATAHASSDSPSRRATPLAPDA